MLAERAENIRYQEQEILTREDKIRRWEREMERLENKAIKETEKRICIQSENERLRTTKIDDSMLIERLRGCQSDIQD